MSHRTASALLLGAAAVLLGGRLGASDLSAPDEPRYAQVSEELRRLEGGLADLIVLHHGGEVYAQKPPLYFWLAASAGSLRGDVDELAARLPSSLAGVGTVALTFAFAAPSFGTPTAWLGASFLLTMNEFAKRSRRAHLDVLLTLLVTGSLVGYWRAVTRKGGRVGNLTVFHACMGLAVLTKGPVGFLVPAMVVAGDRVIARSARDLPQLFPAWGLGLSLGPGLMWLLAATQLTPAGFFGDAVVENLFARFFAGSSHARPIYHYLYQFPIDLLPWSLGFPALIWIGRKGRFATLGGSEAARLRRFLALWALVPFVFFTLSSGKRGLYLLPIYPPVALLLADAAIHALREERERAMRALAWTAAGAGGVLGTLATWISIRPPLGDPTAIRTVGIASGCVVVMGALAWARLPAVRWRARLASLVAAAYCIELAIFYVGMPGLDAERSARPIAEAASALTSADRPIGLLGRRTLASGLLYYGKRPVELLDAPEDVSRFFSDGGGAVVLRAKKLERLRTVVPVEERFRARSGSRTLVVVTRAEDAAR